MKVQVNVKTGPAAEASNRLDLVVSAADTVATVKQRVATLELIPFPEQDLMLNGEVLENGIRLSDCGVKELGTLDFVVRASEATFAKQLTELLQARDLSCDELGLLYCYKHGVSISQALKAVGCDFKLQDFLRKQKGFQLDKNTVSLVREDSSLKPFSVVAEVEQILAACGPGGMDIKDLCAKFVQKFNVSLASLAGMRVVDFLTKEKDLFVVSGRNTVSLRAAAPPAVAPSAPSRARPRAEKPVPREQNVWPLGADAEKPVLVGPPGLEVEPRAEETAESQLYMDLHNRICGRSLTSRAAQVLSDFVTAISEPSCLNVHHIVKSGSIGKGTTIAGPCDAEVVFFVNGLPSNGHQKWLAPLLETMTGVFAEALRNEKGIDGVCTTEDSVQMRVKGLVNVNVRFSPAFASYTEAIQAIGELAPEARRFLSPALTEERVQFIARQPSHVKVTIRLLKWWRDQQEWLGKNARPSDEILELMAVYSAVQTKPTDQRKAIANVMSLLSRFDELRIVWSNYYTKADVWAPLLSQCPLLMDPVNPYVNVADPQAFDASELMELARTTHFFW